MISIVMPCFNAEQVAVKTIEDFANQRYKDFELIIVNDGSTDRSEPIIKDFIDRNNLSWTIISQPHKGVSAARNTGMDLAKGDYVVFCDSDNHFEKNYLLELHQKIIEDGSDVVFCGFDIVYANNNFVEKVARSRLIFTEIWGSALLKKLIADKFAVSPDRMLIRTDIIRKNNIRFDEDLTYGEDYLFMAYVMLYSDKVSCIDNILYHYIQWDGQSTRKTSLILNVNRLRADMFEKLHIFLGRNNVSPELIKHIDMIQLPNTTIKDLSEKLRSGHGDLFRECLKDQKYRDRIEKSQCMFCFIRKPETWLKGFELLHCPSLFYKHYINRGDV